MTASKSSVAALLAAWDSAESPSAPITSLQREAIDAISAKETDDTGTAEDITGLPTFTIESNRRVGARRSNCKPILFGGT